MNIISPNLILDQDVTEDQIFSLLPSQATLDQARVFLSQKGLSFSAGSWATMISHRFKPALKSGALSLADIAEFLCSAEEHGKQHVLLYRASSRVVKRIFDLNYLEGFCRTEPRFPMLNSRSVVAIPDKPKISEVRHEGVGGNSKIVIKWIEKRDIKNDESYKEWYEDGYLYTRIETKPYRAANIVRISLDGLCEVRIHSHSEAFDYETEARAQLSNLDPLFSSDDFISFSLSKARSFVCDPIHRDDARKLFDLRHTEHLDSADGRLRPSVGGMSGSMLENKAVTDAIDAFQRSESFVHRAGLTMKESQELTRRINVNLSGADNEFFLSAKVTRSEYEFILGAILKSVEKMKR